MPISLSIRRWSAILIGGSGSIAILLVGPSLSFSVIQSGWQFDDWIEVAGLVLGCSALLTSAYGVITS